MAAIAWWTDQVDQERERAQLAEMMRISLEEAERRRAAVLPLHEWSDAELLAHFAGSALLAQVQAAVPAGPHHCEPCAVTDLGSTQRADCCACLRPDPP